jgi:hypothetical protein
MYKKEKCLLSQKSTKKVSLGEMSFRGQRQKSVTYYLNGSNDLKERSLNLSRSHRWVGLDGEGETSSGEVNYDMLWLLELSVIVGVQDDAIRQRQRLGGALARFHQHHCE